MNSRFLPGFLGGILLFLLINLLAAHLASDCGLPGTFGHSACADAISRAGWPLQFYEAGGVLYRRSLSLPVLLVDLLAGLSLAFLSGWFFSRLKERLPK